MKNKEGWPTVSDSRSIEIFGIVKAAGIRKDAVKVPEDGVLWRNPHHGTPPQDSLPKLRPATAADFVSMSHKPRNWAHATKPRFWDTTTTIMTILIVLATAYGVWTVYSRLEAKRTAPTIEVGR